MKYGSRMHGCLLVQYCNTSAAYVANEPSTPRPPFILIPDFIFLQLLKAPGSLVFIWHSFFLSFVLNMPRAHPNLIFGGGGIGDEFKTAESVSELLQTLKSLGITTIDTAALYPPTNIGASETLLGQVGAAEQGFTIDTKILALGLDADGTLEPAAIEKSLNTSYDRLKLQDRKVNVLYCHTPDRATPLNEQAAGLDVQYKKGRFKRLGVCGFPLDMLTEFVEICEREGYIKPSVYLGRYNVLCRELEEAIPTFRKHGISLDAHSPLAGGFLTGRLTAGDIEGTRFAEGNIMGAHARQQYDSKDMHDAIHYLTKTLEPAGISKIEASLRWLCYHSMLGPDDSIVLGASKLPQLVQNVEAIRKGPLPDDIVAALDKL
ncbi:Aldo/keto reductase [Xylariaceae sp. FL0662B]|nr:Aldo/keto reductase [Xylariaceae sp. FL0662B]